MPEVVKVPEKLKPYLFHGIDLQYRDGAKEAVGECPFCGREKFSVVIETGLWRCLVCNEGKETGKLIKGGNSYIFIRALQEHSLPLTGEYDTLSDDIGLFRPATLHTWGICRSLITRDWLVPGYGADGHLNQLYRYVHSDKEQRWLLMPTPTHGHQLHGVSIYDKAKPIAYLCEGWKDGLALWEALSLGKMNNGKIAQTSNAGATLLAEASVLATPACGTFSESWLPLFAGKRVRLCYDNDHERVHPKTGQPIAPAGYEETKRVAGFLLAAKQPPESVEFLQWHPSGWNTDLKSGYDVRDLLCK